MGRLKHGNYDVSPKRLASDIQATSTVDLEESIDTQEAALQSAQIEALYQAGRAMAAVSTILEDNLL